MRLTASALWGALFMQSAWPVVVGAHAEERQVNLLARDVLVQPTYATFPVADFTTADYSVSWEGEPIAGVGAALQLGTLEWVATNRGPILPRAVLRIQSDSAEGGIVEHAGSTHPFREDAHGGVRVELPVALLSGSSNPVTVRVRRNGRTMVGMFVVRFRPRPEHRAKLVVDATCSPYALRVRAGSIPADTWLQLRCRMVQVKRAGAPTATLEVSGYWDNLGPGVTVGGVDVPGEPEGSFVFRLEAKPGTLRFEARESVVVLGYNLPPTLSAGFLNAGIGPYLYSFRDDQTDLSTGANLLTIYAGYTLEPTMRVVYFNATALHTHYFSDQGLYLWLEQSTVLDGRLSINLLLGMHTLLFERNDELKFVPSFPQGIEGVFRDCLRPAHNLSGGAFLYPEIEGRSYYNLWLRWGSSRGFWEINYIAWKEPFGRAWVESQSLGITVGIPLLRFL